MKNLNSPDYYTYPVVIGGVGGSGTRLITRILNELGFFMGSDLNEAYDNLWFTLLFKRKGILTVPEDEFSELVEIFLKGMSGSENFTKKQTELINQLTLTDRKEHSTKWLKKRAHALLSRKKLKIQSSSMWGWKEPNSHIVLDRLIPHFRNIKYIHVTRNGLDMAHSSNQNQLKFWGQEFIGTNFEITSRSSLRYWCIVHKRVLEIGRSMGSNFLFLNYDDFCTNPENGIYILRRFLGLDDRKISVSALTDMVDAPASIGRFKQHGTDIFDGEDVAYVKELGFDTEAI